MYMGYRYDEFAPGEVYHICTRGVESRNIFRHDSDKDRFHKLMLYCLSQEQTRSFSLALRFKHKFVKTQEGEGLVDLLCYCLMDNHIHLLVKENVEAGVSKYMQKLLNSHAKYFNMSQQRTGSLFANPFKAVLVDGDDQLLHVSRYIHLNPYVAHIGKDVLAYQWSSLHEYVCDMKNRSCHTKLISSLMGRREYEEFVMNEADYAQSLHDHNYLLVDNEV